MEKLIEKKNLLVREWFPLNDLLNKIPLKHQSGLFSQEVKLTCISVLEEFIALGTNCGVIYWYDRNKQKMQCLRCENFNIPVTSIALVSSVHYMLACGNRNGTINIFQIPKTHSDLIPENLKPKNEQVERYFVTKLHNASVTALEWAKNGMKLFSGDKNGVIVLTEIDFYMHISKSLEIFNESYEVVQISYSRQKLLISTIYRSIICHKTDKWNVSQVGKKDRKFLGSFGGILCQNRNKINEQLLYCARPGLRIWVADIEGNVLKTILFKDLLIKEAPDVAILNPISTSLELCISEKHPSFGVILSFCEDLLVAYNNDVVYILNPNEMTVISAVRHLRSILSLAINKDEIFIIEEARNVIRISPKCEIYNNLGNSQYLPESNKLTPITNVLKDLSSKWESSMFLPLASSENINGVINIETDGVSIVNAEEATETAILNIKGKNFDSIGEENFSDEILFKQNRHRKKELSSILSSCCSNELTKGKKGSFTEATLMNLSSLGVLLDSRSHESIQSDIQNKEKILAKILNFDRIKLDRDNSKHSNSSSNLNGCLTPTKPTISEEENTASYIGKNTESNIGSLSFTIKCSNDESATELDRVENLQQDVKTSSSLSSNGSLSQSYTKIPECINIPSDWTLSNVTIYQDAIEPSLDKTDISLSDWEIL